MSHIGQKIEFSSPAFPPCKEDEELVNHEIMHGYALARSVADHLSRHGFEVLRMVAEDWGWWCQIRNNGYELSYGCGSHDRAGDFVLFVKPDTPDSSLVHDYRRIAAGRSLERGDLRNTRRKRKSNDRAELGRVAPFRRT